MFGDIRKLPYPLYNPVASGGVVGSDDNESPNDTVTWVTSDPNERVVVELELSLNEYVALASSLDVGRDIAYGTESQFIWWLWTRAFIRTISGEPITPISPTSDIDLANSPVAVFVINELESENMLKIEVIDGKPYLEEDCGCGVRKYYTLTASSVNPQTGAVSDIIDTVPEYITNIPLTEEQISTCYAEKVAQTIIGALSEYTYAVFDYALIGAAAFAPVATVAFIGAIEIQQAIVESLNGNLQLNLQGFGYTADEVVAVFESDEFVQFIIDRLGGSQQIARWHLGLVSVRLSNRSDLNFPTPISPVFNAWVAMVNMSALNQALEIGASECANGISLPDGFPTTEYLLAQGYDWAHSYDLRDAAFVDNTSFDWIQVSAVDAGQWVEGVGLESLPDLLTPPHAIQSLQFRINHSGAAGTGTYNATKYTYEVAGSDPTFRGRVVYNETLDKDTNFSGIYENTGGSWSSGARQWQLTPVFVPNSSSASGGIAVVSRLAFAGTGDDPLAGLVQV